MSRSALVFAAVALAAGSALAKLPPPSEEAKAKAAEAAARTKWSAAVAGYKLCQAQDRVAARYREDAQRQGKTVPEPISTSACKDPGPFAYTPPPGARPLEASEAHSPPATAAQPPSTQTPHAQTDDEKKP